MTKTLSKHGNSWALVIDRPVMDLLKIDPDTPLEVETDGTRLVITPVARKDRVKAALKKMDEKYGKMMKRLAE